VISWVSSARPAASRARGSAGALQDRQVRLADVAGQRGHRHQLPHQVLDPGLVLSGGLGAPGTSPDPPIQRRRVRPGQLKPLQPAGAGQRDAGQRLSIDPVGLGMPAQEPPQVRGLGRGHPVHVMAAAAEEHRDRQPGRPGRLEHHRQPRAFRRPSQRRLLQAGQGLHCRHARGPAHQPPICLQHPHRVPRRDAQVYPDQPPGRWRPSLLLLRPLPLLHIVGNSLAPALQTGSNPSATVPRCKSPATAPIHVLQPAHAL